jgi:ribonuclease P protein component
VDTDHFRVFVLHRGDGGAARLGITVTRKVGNAVRRNRIKRLVREWFRSCSHEMGPCDLIVVVKRDLPVALRLREVQRDLDRGLRPYRHQGSSC